MDKSFKYDDIRYVVKYTMDCNVIGYKNKLSRSALWPMRKKMRVHVTSLVQYIPRNLHAIGDWLCFGVVW